MRFLRRVLKISWTERDTIGNVLRWACVERKLQKTVKKRPISFLGHVNKEDNLEGAVVGERVNGRRDRRRRWLSDLHSLTLTQRSAQPENGSRLSTARQRLTDLYKQKGRSWWRATRRLDFIKSAEKRVDVNQIVADVCTRSGTLGEDYFLQY